MSSWLYTLSIFFRNNPIPVGLFLKKKKCPWLVLRNCFQYFTISSLWRRKPDYIQGCGWEKGMVVVCRKSEVAFILEKATRLIFLRRRNKKKYLASYPGSFIGCIGCCEWWKERYWPLRLLGYYYIMLYCLTLSVAFSKIKKTLLLQLRCGGLRMFTD